jgi:hypothetical protein
MIEPKFTPGPWRFGLLDWINSEDKFIDKPLDYVGPGYYDNPVICGKNGEIIVGCDEYFIFSTSEDIALLLSAPDLYEALEEVVRISDRKHDAWDKAKAALARARGEA